MPKPTLLPITRIPTAAPEPSSKEFTGADGVSVSTLPRDETHRESARCSRLRLSRHLGFARWGFVCGLAGRGECVHARDFQDVQQLRSSFPVADAFRFSAH